VLVDAATDEPLTQLRDEAIVDLSELGTRALNIVAEVASAGDDASVRFGLDGSERYRIENEAPFALAGNIGSDYRSWTPSLGSHVLMAEPYAERDAEGAAGAALSIAFDVRE
jgi:hypothetical protein